MIELTTGVVFLMSSLYGSGQATTHSQAMADMTKTDQVTTTAASSFTGTNDPRIVEAYLRREFADTPILVDIARCESEFRQFDKDGSLIRGRAVKSDVGVMQINEYYQGDTAKKLGFDLHTIEGNVAYAKHLYADEGSKPWNSSQKCWSKGDGLAKK